MPPPMMAMKSSTSMAVSVRVLSVPRDGEGGGHPGHGALVGRLEDVEEVVGAEQRELLEHLHAHRLDVGVDLAEPLGVLPQPGVPVGSERREHHELRHGAQRYRPTGHGVALRP